MWGRRGRFYPETVKKVDILRSLLPEPGSREARVYPATQI
jgi:hypothetical protein